MNELGRRVPITTLYPHPRTPHYTLYRNPTFARTHLLYTALADFWLFFIWFLSTSLCHCCTAAAFSPDSLSLPGLCRGTGQDIQSSWDINFIVHVTTNLMVLRYSGVVDGLWTFMCNSVFHTPSPPAAFLYRFTSSCCRSVWTTPLRRDGSVDVVLTRRHEWFTDISPTLSKARFAARGVAPARVPAASITFCSSGAHAAHARVNGALYRAHALHASPTYQHVLS